MKIIKRNLNKENEGSITVKAITEEDIWYLYNIIKSNDLIKMRVFRKTKNQKSEYGVTHIKRHLISLCMKILKVNF